MGLEKGPPPQAGRTWTWCQGSQARETCFLPAPSWPWTRSQCQVHCALVPLPSAQPRSHRASGGQPAWIVCRMDTEFRIQSHVGLKDWKWIVDRVTEMSLGFWGRGLNSLSRGQALGNEVSTGGKWVILRVGPGGTSQERCLFLSGRGPWAPSVSIALSVWDSLIHLP